MESVSECSTLASFAQDAVQERTIEVTLHSVYSGTVFAVKDNSNNIIQCMLAGVVAPIPKQPGFELSMEKLQEKLADVSFLIIMHESCAQWYQSTPVSVIANDQDVIRCLLQEGWVQIDRYMPKKCHRTMFIDKTYYDLLHSDESIAVLTSRGLYQNPCTRDEFMHPKDYYDAVLKDQDEPLPFYFATKSVPSEYEPFDPT